MKKQVRPGSNPAELEADLSLARRCATDVGAREELFRLHAPVIFRLARRLLGNPADAEDVLQEVFIDVFAALPTYRGDGRLRTWLSRIAVRRALRHRRQPARAHLELVASNEASTDGAAVLDSRATLRRINALLDRLSDDRRVMFVLHEVEGYSLPEAAALVGISVTAAKKRVWRARRELERLARGDPALEPLFGKDGGDV